MSHTIGIDPGAVTGIALLNDEGVYPKSFEWGKDGEAVFAHLRGLATLLRGPVRAVIEKPARGYHPRNVSQRANFKIAMNVGQCAEKAAAIAGFCRHALGWEVVERAPVRGLTKLTAAQFARYFPTWKGPTSSHSRDAAMLALVQHGQGQADPEYHRRQAVAKKFVAGMRAGLLGAKKVEG